jgi:L-methionine (R)-S-oxide reductase
MSESLIIPTDASREVIYKSLVPQIAELVSFETDVTANLANISAALKEAFGFFWVGFYIKKGNELLLGPFQGPIACTRIPFHKGVCGHCYTTKQIVIVPNVDEFPGHIACASASKSEIVLPAFDKNGDVTLVLDVDSDQLNDFSEIDAKGLGAVIKIIEKMLNY